MHRYAYNTLRNFFISYVVKPYTTRHFSSIRHAFASTHSRKCSITVVDPITWNELPTEFRYIFNLSFFKIQLRPKLIECSGKTRANTPTLSCAYIPFSVFLG